MEPGDKELPRMECPQLSISRYNHLKPSVPIRDPEIPYFFALDLRDCLNILPRLIGSVVEVIRFLGPERCALSIVEGHSPDGTGEVLQALKTELDVLPTTYYFQSTDIDPTHGDRIAKLATLRNMAVQPMLLHPKSFSADTTVVFINDVAICPEDILELLHQRRHLDADMTCAFDWTYVGRDPTFYDVWVARGMNGDSFFEVPADGSWDSAWNLFWNDPEAQSRYSSHRPFQAFSCWNGAAAFTAAPIVEKKVAFRGPREGECGQGEPQLFCKDLWFNGYGRIAVVPAVSLGYSDATGRQIKEAKGYTSQWVGQDGQVDDTIEWQHEPPERIKCMPAWENQHWQLWNETLR